MSTFKIIGRFVLTLSLIACAPPSSNDSAVCASSVPSSGQRFIDLSGSNVLSVTVNGALCGSAQYQYINEPCTSVTLCAPGTSNCQTINNILVDTGSFGLRIFSSVITVPLTQMTSSGKSIAECAQFGTGSDWGPIKKADVKLGGEPTLSNLPIHVIDSTFATVPTVCGTVDTSPQEAGFNGILGIGLFAEDCGSYCATHAANQTYFACNGSSCTGTAVSIANQVQNPVASLPVDNNGVMLEFPEVPAKGTKSVNGYLVLGIGTQSNNIPSSVTTYYSDATGNFTTTIDGRTISGFIDSGSNGLYFENSYSYLPACKLVPPFFCPSCATNLTATNVSNGNTTKADVEFQIANFESLFRTGNSVFPNNGANLSGTFDWGLPFFYGRTVFVGIEGTSSSLGTGPYWAY